MSQEMMGDTAPAESLLLRGRVAVVTGGASGIGAAIVRAFAGAGARVAIADVRELEDPPAGARYLETDVTRGESVDSLYRRVLAEWGAPDLLVVCAGQGIHERLAEGDPEKWARVLDLNVMGALRAVRAFVPAMLERGTGDVVFLSSVSARHAYPYGGVYAASKAALEMVAETLRLETQPAVRVTVVSPGVVDTPFFDRAPGHPGNVADLGWDLLVPEEVAQAVVFAVTRPRGTALNGIVLRPAGQPM